MANALGTLFGDIATAIREKTGDTATMKPAEFPEKIAAIEAGGGGGSLPAGAYWEALSIPYAKIYRQKWFQINGNLYAFINSTSGNGGLRYIYKYVNNAWTLVYDAGKMLLIGNADYLRPVEYNGKWHFYGGESKVHYTFDGTSFVSKKEFPSYCTQNRKVMFVQNGKLKVQLSDYAVYVWDETNDAWTKESSGLTTQYDFYEIDGVVYAARNSNVYIYSDGTLGDFTTLSVRPYATGVVKDGKIYFLCGNSTLSAQTLYEFDPTTKIMRKVGAIPTMGSSKVLSVFDHRIAFMSYECSFASTIVLHEVTE